MNQEQQLNDILEIVRFLKDECVTHRELDTKLKNLRGDLITHIDGLVVFNQRLDVEPVSMRAKYERLESYIQQLAQHSQVILH